MVDARYDVAVIGAGIIGLSTAMQLLRIHPELSVAVIEKDAEIASQQSGHNSGVIHSGIYYRPGSFKARFCVEGRETMSRFCEENGIACKPIGKLILANSDQEMERLDLLYARGTANGVPELQIVGPDRLREIEPHVSARRALWAPHTGIVDFKDVARAYRNRIENAGGAMHLSCAVRSIQRSRSGVTVQTSGGDCEVKAVRTKSRRGFEIGENTPGNPLRIPHLE